jgi:hypothetical protein
MMAKVNAVDSASLRAALEGNGIAEPAILGAIARLDEIKANGAITGEQWPGKIISDYRIGPYHNPIYGPREQYGFTSNSDSASWPPPWSSTPVSHPPLGPADHLPSLEVLEHGGLNGNPNQ